MRRADLSRYAALRDGGLLPSAPRTFPTAAAILIAGALALFVALGVTMAPRVATTAAACAADGCAALATAGRL